MKQLIKASTGPSVGSYSPGLEVGDWIYLAGQGGVDPATGALVGAGVEDQTAQALRNVAVLLHACGAGLEHVVSCLVHLTDLADFPSFNHVYAQHFIGTLPVRTTVRADLLAGMKVEITVVAHRSARADLRRTTSC